MIKKMSFLFILMIAALMILSCDSSTTPGVIHQKAIVVDAHNDTLMWLVTEDEWLPDLCLNQDLTDKTRDGHIDLPRLLEGGIDVPFFAVWLSDAERHYGERTLDRSLALINCLYWQLERNHDLMELGRSYQEIIDIVEEGKISAVLTMEGAYSIRRPYGLELLRQYHDLGMKVIGLTWNYSNELAEGVKIQFSDFRLPPPGLTDYGREFVQEMNRLGMVVDVSHMSENSFWDVIEISEAPVIASHSNVTGLKLHERNLTDEQLKALAENGGVIHINFFKEYLGGDQDLQAIVDNIDYAVELIGVDYVGLGSDFDGGVLPEDISCASRYPDITEELVRRGYTREDIEKILGLNSLRVIREVEKIGEEIRWAEGGGGELLPRIVPDLEMGEIIEDSTPVLTARVESNGAAELPQLDYRLILDGYVYEPELDTSNSLLKFQVEEPLEKGFHIVTFAAAGETAEERSTVIFHRRH